jgi:hypothetical protein
MSVTVIHAENQRTVVCVGDLSTAIIDNSEPRRGESYVEEGY